LIHSVDLVNVFVATSWRPWEAGICWSCWSWWRDWCIWIERYFEQGV